MSTLAVLGMPNTGKSTLFNRLTGHHAHIGNWPGLTVELMQAGLELSGRTLQLVDLPGIYDLRGQMYAHLQRMGIQLQHQLLHCRTQHLDLRRVQQSLHARHKIVLLQRRH